MAIGGVAVSLFWLLNFTMGIVEIPDNLPFVGNVDEAVAAGIFFASLRYLGIDLIPFGNRRRSVPKAEVVESKPAE